MKDLELIYSCQGAGCSGNRKGTEAEKAGAERTSESKSEKSELSERTGEDSAENRVREGKTETDLPPQSCSPLAVVMA